MLVQLHFSSMAGAHECPSWKQQIVQRRWAGQMIYKLPGQAGCITIFDEWLSAGGVEDFTPTARAYASTCDVLVSLGELVLPAARLANLFPHATSRDRVISLLTAMRTGAPLCPIRVGTRGKEFPEQHVILDGAHRFCLSVAVGYAQIPIEVHDNFQFELASTAVG
jgi:hypothetical protein